MLRISVSGMYYKPQSWGTLTSFGADSEPQHLVYGWGTWLYVIPHLSHLISSQLSVIKRALQDQYQSTSQPAKAVA